MHKVFVYGTLKKGQSAFEYLMLGRPFVGNAISLKKFAVYKTGGFPTALDGDVAPIRGEIYEVDDVGLSRLDSYEGNGLMFQRQYQEFQCDNGEKITAYIYLGMGSYWKKPDLPLTPVNEHGHFEWRYGC